MKKLNIMDWISYILVIVGGINWGLLGLTGDFNLVEVIFGEGAFANIIYILFGLASLYLIYYLFTVSSKKTKAEKHEPEMPEPSKPESELDVE